MLRASSRPGRRGARGSQRVHEASRYQQACVGAGVMPAGRGAGQAPLPPQPLPETPHTPCAPDALRSRKGDACGPGANRSREEP